MKWFFGTLALLAVAMVLNLGLLAYAMYALLGILLVSRVLTRVWSENLRASRQCNRLSANIGDTVAVVITLENHGRLPVVWAMLDDILSRNATQFRPPKLEVVGSRLGLASLGIGGRKTFYYQLQCQGRGYFQIGPLVLETGDLFGLHRRYRVLTEPHFLLVYPKVVPLEGFDIASRRPIGEIRLSLKIYEDPTRIAGTRPYEPGDPLNRVHWRATARTGDLHSKIYEPTAIAGATLLLDFHRDAYDPHHEPLRSELAVTAAASLASALYDMGQQVGLVTNGRDAAERVRQEGWEVDFRTRQAARCAASAVTESQRLQPVLIPTSNGPEQLMRILETLARVELSDGLKLDQLIAETAGHIPRDAAVIAIVSSVHPEMAVALGGLRRRGFLVTALVNAYYEHDFERIAAPLLAERVPARHLKNFEDIGNVCRERVFQ